MSLFGIGQEQGAGAVVDTRGVAGSNAAACAERGAEFLQLFQGGVTAWVLILGDDLGRALALGNLDRDDFLGETAIGHCRGSAVLAAQGEGVLVGAGDVELFGDVLCGFRHGVDAVLLLHQRVDEAPADGGVEQFSLPRERGVGLAHYQRRARHGFDAANQHQPGFTTADGASGAADGIQARTAQAVEGGARYADRQAGQQARHARDVAVVFTGLVGAAIDDVVDAAPVHLWVAFDQGAQRYRAQVVGTHAAQCTGIAADGGADRIDDQGVFHSGVSCASTVPRTL
ncbi:hypothetical protein D3C80_1203270 [compost metagenome]